jgi:hypothetical protein
MAYPEEVNLAVFNSLCASGIWMDKRDGHSVLN